MRVLDLPHYDRIAAELPDADIFVGLLLRPEQLRQAAKLKWVHTTSAGVGQLMYPAFRASGITLTNASGVHAPAMAEHIAGMLVAMARDFPGSMRFQAQRKWGQQEIWDGRSRPRELSGADALLVGFGAVGRAAAERLRAFGMRIRAVTRSGQAEGSLAERVFSDGGVEAGARGSGLRDLGRAGNARDAPPDGRRTAGGHETQRDPGERGPRVAGGPGGLDRRS